jgi:hypothetical protein
MPVTASPTLSLQPNALVSVQTVKDELGILNSDTSADQRLIRMINQASDLIEDWCGRMFYRAFAVETVSFPSQPQTPFLYLSRFPLVNARAVETILQDLDPGPGTTLDSSNWYVDDVSSSRIFMRSRWAGTALRRPDIAQDYDPGTEEQTVSVAYSGGFITQPQLDAAIGVQWAANTAYHAGDLINPSANSGTQIWMCSTPGTSGVSVQPSWPASPVKGTTTLADTGGSLVVWTYLGAKLTNDGRTLSSTIEGAAVDAVVSFWRRRGQSLEVSSERLGQASVTYGGTGGQGRLVLPSAVQDALESFKVVL